MQDHARSSRGLQTLTVEEAGSMPADVGLETLTQPLLREWVGETVWHRHDAMRPSHLWAMARARVPST